MDAGSMPAINTAFLGVVGDGTTDNAAALQKAINGAPDYSVISLPAGIVGIGAAGIVLTSRNGIIIQGPGQIKLLGAASNAISSFGSWAFLFSGCTKSGIRGVVLNGNGEGGLAGFTGCADSGMWDCDVSDSGQGSGIAQVGSVGGTRSKFLNNVVHDSGGTTVRGMWLGNINAGQIETDLKVFGNEVVNNSATGIVTTSTGGRVGNNRSENNAGSGIIVSGNDTVTSSNVTVYGNVCSGNLFHGIQSDATGVTVGGLPFGITVAGNVCEGNTVDGIFAVNTNGWCITGNTCFNNGDLGIQCDDNCYATTITGNLCFDTRSGGSRTQGTGIQVNSNVAANQVENIAISGNVCRNNLVYGITVNANSTYTVDRVTVNGNVCADNGTDGIKFSEATVGNVTAVCSGNICRGNGSLDMVGNIANLNLGPNTYDTEQNIEYINLTSLSTTPTVYSRVNWRANNGSATSITNFLSMADGQDLQIYASNGNTTLVNGTLILKGATNASIPANGFIRLRQVDGTIYETGRSF